MSHRVVITVAALVLAAAVGLVAAQDKAKTQTALGVVAKIGGDSLSVDTSKGIMQFVTTSATEVEVAGGGSKERSAKREGKKGVKITEVVHQGDQVTVMYTDVAGKLTATSVEVRERRPQSAQPVK